MSTLDSASAAASPAGRAHAIVIGASIGALCAAEILARSFERVTLVERDVLPDSPKPRRGVPQGTQPHGVLARGRKELDALFPGLFATLIAQGAVAFDASLQAARFTPQGWVPRYPGLTTPAFACTRPLLELTMRKLLLKQRANVSIIEGTRVTELLAAKRDGGVWIEGVRTDSADPALRDLRAELVVDASGRGSKAYKWMVELGLPEPEELRVDAHGNYATRFYRAPKEAQEWGWRSILIDNDPPTFRRACAILAVENDQWMVTAAGINGDYAPTDEAGWLAFIRSTRSPAVYEMLQRAEPLGDVAQSRTTVNRWRTMHRYDAPLHGLLMFGDAVCSYNPIYGQGITASALAARALESALEGHRGAHDKRFLARCYAAQSGFQTEGWAFSTTLDLRWPDTDGERSWLSRVFGYTADRLQEVALHDPRLLKKLLPFSDFGARRTSLLDPVFIARTLAALVQQRIQKRTLPADIDLFMPLDQVLAAQNGRARASESAAAPAAGPYAQQRQGESE
jgi:2-polyprenyl-6-methoxyphenol hydroxylase-like FAD-dependent oxidoreductase